MSTYLKQVIILFLLLTISCKEEFIIETQDFESVLVVEATITNELKHQEVKLSRTYLLEGSEQVYENNAAVSVVDSSGNRFNFSQNSEGVYISDSTFEALAGIDYTLVIHTTGGKTYNSTTQKLTPISQIDNLYAELVDDDVKGIGVQIFIDSNNDNSDAQYFRYEFEETYKVVPPNYFGYETILSNYVEVIVPGNPGDINVFFDTEFVLRMQEEENCYISRIGKEIIQATTNNLDQNTVQRLPIRFITEETGSEPLGIPIKEDQLLNDISILRERYSIEVHQFVQSIEDYSFYKTIDELGNNGSILSESQPGYVKGNMQSIDNINEKVVGFFAVSSVSKKRIFFNYSDFDIVKPDYFFDCLIREFDYSDNTGLDEDNNERYDLYWALKALDEFNYNDEIIQLPTSLSPIWRVANAECTDCTSIGSNLRPDFWID